MILPSTIAVMLVAARRVPLAVERALGPRLKRALNRSPRSAGAAG